MPTAQTILHKRTLEWQHLCKCNRNVGFGKVFREAQLIKAEFGKALIIVFNFIPTTKKGGFVIELSECGVYRSNYRSVSASGCIEWGGEQETFARLQQSPPVPLRSLSNLPRADIKSDILCCVWMLSCFFSVTELPKLAARASMPPNITGCAVHAMET